MTNATRYAHLRDTAIPCLNQEHGESWSFYHGDSCQVLKGLPDACVDYVMTSIPFSSLYTYSPTSYDIGNCTTDEQFAEHFRYLAAEMFRFIRPGRVVSIHCMDLPTTLSRDGMIGIRDFRGLVIKIFQTAGFIWHSNVTIRKNPVTQMTRTNTLGLLYKTLRGDRKQLKPHEMGGDSIMSRMGLADYLLQFYRPEENPDVRDLFRAFCEIFGQWHRVDFRHPAENEEPIQHCEADFPIERWQRYAEPVWDDIRESDTLQYMSAREFPDEKHICPLQLEVIRRGIDLWSNPGDVVLDPFGGIGSTGHCALQMNRRAVLCELKPSYWRQGVENLRRAAPEGQKQLKLAGME